MYRMGRKKAAASKSKKVLEEEPDTSVPMDPSLAKPIDVSANLPMEEQVQVQQLKDSKNETKEQESSTQTGTCPAKSLATPRKHQTKTVASTLGSGRMVPAKGNEGKRNIEVEEEGEQSPSLPKEFERDSNQPVITSFFKKFVAMSKDQGESSSEKVQVAQTKGVQKSTKDIEIIAEKVVESVMDDKGSESTPTIPGVEVCE